MDVALDDLVYRPQSTKPIPRLEWLRLPGNDLPLPAYQSDGAACFDLQACFTGENDDVKHALKFSGAWKDDGQPIDPKTHHIVIPSGGKFVVPTGFAVAVPAGFELQVRPRSGMAIRDEIIVLNSPGTVDSDYRGEIFVGLKNLSNRPFHLTHGMRIAQARPTVLWKLDHVEVEALSTTARGEGRFGSTGR